MSDRRAAALRWGRVGGSKVAAQANEINIPTPACDLMVVGCHADDMRGSGRRCQGRGEGGGWAVANSLDPKPYSVPNQR